MTLFRRAAGCRATGSPLSGREASTAAEIAAAAPSPPEGPSARPHEATAEMG